MSNKEKDYFKIRKYFFKGKKKKNPKQANGYQGLRGTLQFCSDNLVSYLSGY